MAHLPGAEAGSGEGVGDRPLTVGRVLDDVDDDRVDGWRIARIWLDGYPEAEETVAARYSA